MEVELYIQCMSCKESVPDTDKFCISCGAFLEGNIHEANLLDQAQYYVKEAAGEFIEVGKDLKSKDMGEKIANGVTLGAMVGISLFSLATDAAKEAKDTFYRYAKGNKKD